MTYEFIRSALLKNEDDENIIARINELIERYIEEDFPPKDAYIYIVNTMCNAALYKSYEKMSA